MAEKTVLVVAISDGDAAAARHSLLLSEEDYKVVTVTPLTGFARAEGLRYDEMLMTPAFKRDRTVQLMLALRRSEIRWKGRPRKERFEPQGLARGQRWYNKVRADTLVVVERFQNVGRYRAFGDQMWVVERETGIGTFRYLATEHSLWERGYRLKKEG